MKRWEIAPGAFVTEVPGDKFKHGKIAVHFVTPGRRENATALAVLPHVLDRRCAAVPDPLALSRLLFSLYGASLASESYTAGANRVLAFGVSGLKNEYALEGEDLAGQYLDLLCHLLFRPVLEGEALSAEDVDIEKNKQADFLRSERNDKRSYCLRQARRKLYGASPLGIESPGYLGDIPHLTPKGLYGEWQALLRTAPIEILVCGASVQAVARRFEKELAAWHRAPAPLAETPPVPKPAACAHYAEPMPTAQGKLCILLAGGQPADGRAEGVMRLASALYGGLPTSRLFMNVREKQSLCYYCSSSYGMFGSTLTVDSGVDHRDAQRAADSILHELSLLQSAPVEEGEMTAAKKYMNSVFSSAKDSPDALLNFTFTEWLKGTNRSLDEMMRLMDSIEAREVQSALAHFAPAVQYVITSEEEAQ